MRDPRKCIRIFFVGCVLKEAYSKSYGSSEPGETPQTHSDEEAPGSTVESEPGAEINGHD